MSGKNDKQLPYETSDISVRWVVGAGAILTLATVVSFVLMILAYRFFESREADEAARTVPATLIPVEGPAHPPEPVLQGSPGSRFELADPLLEMIEMTEQEDAELGTAGWVDRDAGVVRLPIERAKELLIERGLPTRAGEGAP